MSNTATVSKLEISPSDFEILAVTEYLESFERNLSCFSGPEVSACLESHGWQAVKETGWLQADDEIAEYILYTFTRDDSRVYLFWCKEFSITEFSEIYPNPADFV